MTGDEMRAALIEAMESSARGNTYAQWTDTILPVVRKIAADELRAAAEDLDAKSEETWRAYKTASPDDPRRANPYYDGAADAYETAATRVLRRADALDPQ